jgi:hypothetical protein
MFRPYEIAFIAYEFSDDNMLSLRRISCPSVRNAAKAAFS